MVTEQNSTPNSVESMIDSLEGYVLDRQIGIADILAREFSDDASLSPLKQSGFAILSICMAYFEMIQQFASGRSSERGKSTEYFVLGYRLVYPWTTLAKEEIELIYSWVRCKMYHSGMTHSGMTKSDEFRMGVHISRHFAAAFYCDCRQIHINPSILVSDIRDHFTKFIADLRNPASVDKRCNFQCYCELIGMNAPLVPQTQSSTSGKSTSTRSPWDQG